MSDNFEHGPDNEDLYIWKYSSDVDIAYIKFRHDKIHKTLDRDGYLMDESREGKLVGLEVFDYSTLTEPQKRQFHQWAKELILLAEREKRTHDESI